MMKLTCCLNTVAVVLIIVAGCSRGPSRLNPPSVSSDAGESAIQKYDGNKDGALTVDELVQSPGLKIAISRIDANNDHRITADEITSRIGKWRESRLALSSMNARVRLDGMPVQNAVVTLVPEDFLGEAVKPASGTTEDDGFASIRISPDPDENGVHLGFYRLQVSKKINGKETIPARYNEKTELGVEIAHDVLDTQNFGIDLRSR
jgi:hypothetical protein